MHQRLQQRTAGTRRPDVTPADGPGSFESVARHELPGLLRFATALCGDPDQARDLVQEVLARAFARWDKIGRVDNPGAYLTRMVSNEFISWRRRWNTRSVLALGDAAIDRGARSVADHGEQVVARDDLARRLASLPRRQQVALVLRYLEGLDYREAADVLGCAEGTVRSACSRGLATLRLAAEHADGPLITSETR
jgi:RNA polymerase sigma factor (sigma-70 family)